MKQTRIHCPYCGSLATLRPASEIHGLSDISAGTYLYVCRRWPTCDAYVTADRRTKQPLGTLANGELRHKRILAHHALHNVQTSLGMKLYDDNDLNCDNFAQAVREYRCCREVITAVANLYLRQQIMIDTY